MLATLAGVAAFLLTHGLNDLANHCDSLSPAWLGALVIAAMGTSAIAALPRVPRYGLVVAYGLVGALSLATLLALAPECTRGPFAALDPLVRSYWYDNVHEGMPVWLQQPPGIAQMLVPPLLGLWSAMRLWQAGQGWLRRFWGEYALVLAGLIVLSVLLMILLQFVDPVRVALAALLRFRQLLDQLILLFGEIAGNGQFPGFVWFTVWFWAAKRLRTRRGLHAKIPDWANTF